MMSAVGWLQLALYVAVLLAITKPLGIYLCKVLDPKEKTFLDWPLKWMERLLYRVFGVDPHREHNWKQYSIAILVFSAVGTIFSYAIMRLQGHLPWHQYVDALSNKTALTPGLSFNTAASFSTNTNWQNQNMRRMFELFTYGCSREPIALGDESADGRVPVLHHFPAPAQHRPLGVIGCTAVSNGSEAAAVS